MLIHGLFLGQVYQFLRIMLNLLALLFLLDQTSLDLPLPFFVEENVTQVNGRLKGVTINNLLPIELGLVLPEIAGKPSFSIPVRNLPAFSSADFDALASDNRKIIPFAL